MIPYEKFIRLVTYLPVAGCGLPQRPRLAGAGPLEVSNSTGMATITATMIVVPAFTGLDEEWQ
jgi:hypothetical protein